MPSKEQIRKWLHNRQQITQRFYLEDCGCCGCYHKPGYTGDCRNDKERFTDPADYARKYWEKAIADSPNVSLIRSNVKVEFQYIGEGFDGDYNEDDEFDLPLWRFYISKWVCVGRDGETDIWEDVKDASYDTTLPLDTKEIILQKLAEIIMDRVEDNINNGRSVKKICEELSWIDESWIK
jgi:hypothetical protein